MHFGLFNLMTQREKSKTAREIYAETVDHVKLVEDIGFEIAWFAEHHFSNYCLCPSPVTMSAHMAAVTSRIKLGPAVIVAPLYEPVRLLEDIGFADQISDGRLVLGFGTGYQEYEFHKFGVDLKNAREMFLETIDLVDAYLSGDPLEFAGKYVSIPETYFSVRMKQARPDIYVAGMAGDPETQRRAVERGYVPFFTTGWNPIEAIEQMRAKVVETQVAAGAAPDSVPFAIQRYVFVTENREDALQAAAGARYIRRIAMSMRNNYGRLDGAFLEEIPAEDEPPLEEIVDRVPMGDPDTVAERLAVDIERLQATHISCFMGIPGMPHHKNMKSIELFGSKVMPLLEKRFGSLGGMGIPVPGRRAA